MDIASWIIPEATAFHATVKKQVIGTATVESYWYMVQYGKGESMSLHMRYACAGSSQGSSNALLNQLVCDSMNVQTGK